MLYSSGKYEVVEMCNVKGGAGGGEGAERR